MAWRHGRVEKAGDWQGGNREVSVMQQGRDLTDLCWHFLFINCTVTDELHNKIPADCRGCRNDPFLGGGRKHKQKREGVNPYFSTFHLRNVFSIFLWKKKLSITQCCTGSPRHAPKVTSAGRAIQHFRAPGSFSMCHFLCKARQEREVGLEVSIVLFPTSCKDLSWPLPVVS